LVSHLKIEIWIEVFEISVLGGLFGPKKEELIGDWWVLHYEEFYNLYSSPNIIRTITSMVYGVGGGI
jgi:hypothetical protein